MVHPFPSNVARRRLTGEQARLRFTPLREVTGLLSQGLIEQLSRDDRAGNQRGYQHLAVQEI